MKEVRKFDPRQEEAVNCEANAVVAAGAGSGKTSVLTERFCRLITSGKAEVDTILTLTFTRKAASEMYERIYRRLKAESASNPAIQEQLEKFDQARISTLDSFCARIVKNGAALFGFAPDFTTDDQKAAEIAETRAFSWVLERCHVPELKHFITSHGFENVWRSFFASLGYKFGSAAEDIDFGTMASSQHAFLLDQLIRSSARFDECSDHVSGLDPSAGKAVERTLSELAGLPSLRECAEKADFALLTEAVDKLSLSRAGTGKSKKEDLLLLREYLDEMNDLKDEILQCSATLDMWPLLEKIFAEAGGYMKAYQADKRAQGIVSFRDVQEMALETLRRHREIREYFKKQFSHIMIDEFQDNNILQKKLLFYLAEKEELFGDDPRPEDLTPGKLFFVGDEKQSIYRFRGADVSVFKTLCGEMEESGGTYLELPYNYRSSSGMVSFFNHFFTRVMGEGGQDWEARFAPLQAGRKGESEPDIHLFYKPYNDSGGDTYAGNDEAEAWRIAWYIRESVEKKKLSVLKEDTMVPAGYADFALLMRSTSNQVVYERIFRHLGIPYVSDTVRTLFLEAPFNDFYYAMQLALYRSDRTAYAAFLRSPFTALSDDSVALLLLRDEEPFTAAPEELDLEPPERERYRKARELYLGLRSRITAVPYSETVRYLWYNTGYRYFLLKNRDNHPYLEYYDYLYRLARECIGQGMNISAFLDFMRSNLGKYERLNDIEVFREKQEGVHILTIHKSKGLEYPVVILANTGNMGRNPASGELYYWSPRFGLTFAWKDGAAKGNKKRKNWFYERAKAEVDQQEIAELKRLLYVACTRARDHLVLSGYHHYGNRNSMKAMLNHILAVFPDAAIEESGSEELSGTRFSWSRIPDLPREKLLRKPAASAKRQFDTMISRYRGAQSYSFLPVRKDFRVTELKPADDKWAAAADIAAAGELPSCAMDKHLSGEDDAARFGTLVHHVLEKMITGSWNRQLVTADLLQPFSGDAARTALDCAEEMAVRFLASSLGKRIRDEAVRVYPECDFLYRHVQNNDCYYISGRMDMFFETTDAACVLDYKTDRTIVAGGHDFQLGIYGKAAEALSDKPVEVYTVYLRGPEIIAVPVPRELQISFPASASADSSPDL